MEPLCPGHKRELVVLREALLKARAALLRQTGFVDFFGVSVDDRPRRARKAGADPAAALVEPRAVQLDEHVEARVPTHPSPTVSMPSALPVEAELLVPAPALASGSASVVDTVGEGKGLLRLPAGLAIAAPAGPRAPSIAIDPSGLVAVAHEHWVDVWARVEPDGRGGDGEWRHGARVCPALAADGGARAVLAMALGEANSRAGGQTLLLVASATADGVVCLSTYTLGALALPPHGGGGSGENRLGAQLVCAEALELGVESGEAAKGASALALGSVLSTLLVLSDRRALLALRGGRAAVWASRRAAAVVNSDRGDAGDGSHGEGAGVGGAAAAGNVWLLEPPPWAAAAAADGSSAPALHASARDASLAVSVCARGIAVWCVERRTLLLCFGLAGANALYARGVVTAPYAPADNAEAARLCAGARAACAAGAADAAPLPSPSTALGLVFVAVRPGCDTAGGEALGVWSGLASPGPALPNVRLVAVSVRKVRVLREYSSPPSCAASGAVGGGGWDALEASVHWLVAHSERAAIACVWRVLDGAACVAVVRTDGRAAGVARVRLREAGGGAESAWALWCARADAGNASACPPRVWLEAHAASAPAEPPAERGKRARDADATADVDAAAAMDPASAGGAARRAERARALGPRARLAGLSRPPGPGASALRPLQPLPQLAAPARWLPAMAAAAPGCAHEPATPGAAFGFTTAAGAPIALSTEALARVRSLYQSVLDDDDADDGALALVKAADSAAAAVGAARR